MSHGQILLTILLSKHLLVIGLQNLLLKSLRVQSRISGGCTSGTREKPKWKWRGWNSRPKSALELNLFHHFTYWSSREDLVVEKKKWGNPSSPASLKTTALVRTGVFRPRQLPEPGDVPNNPLMARGCCHTRTCHLLPLAAHLDTWLWPWTSGSHSWWYRNIQINSRTVCELRLPGTAAAMESVEIQEREVQNAEEITCGAEQGWNHGLHIPCPSWLVNTRQGC